MTSWPDAPSPAEATAQWHTEAAKRDEEYLAQGPVDMTETTDGPWSGGDPEGRVEDFAQAAQIAQALIPDPADRLLDPAFLAALRSRYEGMGTRVPAIGRNFPSQFADACDLVVQLLWPETYGTDPDDPVLHTSDPARQIAHLFCDVLGVSADEDGIRVWARREFELTGRSIDDIPDDKRRVR
jgi:hypothetical protein